MISESYHQCEIHATFYREMCSAEYNFVTVTQTQPSLVRAWMQTLVQSSPAVTWPPLSCSYLLLSVTKSKVMKRPRQSYARLCEIAKKK